MRWWEPERRCYLLKRVQRQGLLGVPGRVIPFERVVGVTPQRALYLTCAARISVPFRYYKFVGNCVQCGDGVLGKIINLALLATMVATWIGVNHFLCASLESVDVFLAYIQMCNVIGNYNVDWPDNLKLFVFRVASFLDFDVDIVNFGAPISPLRCRVHRSNRLRR
jgi:hypothetical protein